MEEVKEFIIDLLEGRNRLDLEELQDTEYSMEELVDLVNEHFEDIIDTINDRIGFTYLNIE